MKAEAVSITFTARRGERPTGHTPAGRIPTTDSATNRASRRPRRLSGWLTRSHTSLGYKRRAQIRSKKDRCEHAMATLVSSMAKSDAQTSALILPSISERTPGDDAYVRRIEPMPRARSSSRESWKDGNSLVIRKHCCRVMCAINSAALLLRLRTTSIPAVGVIVPMCWAGLHGTRNP